MGVLTGSISYSRFTVEGDLPPDFRDAYVEAIQHHAFLPLEPEDDREESVGWCSVEHPLDITFNRHMLFFNEYLNLGFRIDKWRLPAPLRKAFFREEERRFLKEHNKERLSRVEKNNIQDFVDKRLKARSFPAMKVIDMSWNVNTGIVRFWNQSQNTCEMFQDYFEETFGLRLVPDSPYTATMKYGLTDEEIALLDRFEVTVFHANVE